MSPSRVLHVVHNYPPEFRGGVERVVEATVRAQRAAGKDARVLCGSERVGDDARVEAATHEGTPVARLVRGPGLRDPIDPFRADLVPLYERELDAFAPEIVHVHHWANLGDDLVRRAARRRIPVVVTLHDFYATCGLFFRLPDARSCCDLPQEEATCGPCLAGRFGVDEGAVRFRVATRRAAFAAELRAAAVVLAPSEAHRAALVSWTPPDAAIEVLSPGSDPAPPVPRRERTGPLRVLHFGNLCRLKGAAFLAEAVERADPTGTTIDLVFAGPVVDADLDLRGRRTVGPFDAARLRELAADADVAAFPSFARESYGLVVDEALRLGLRVLTSDRGALGERVGLRGRVLPAGDVGAWSRELARLAADPSAVARLREGAHARLLTPAESAAELDAVYVRAASTRPPVVDLEAPLVRRVAELQRVAGDLYERLVGRNAERGP